jgi:hypothetical protein
MIAHEQQAQQRLEQQLVAEVRGLWQVAQQLGSAEKVEQLVLEWRQRAG